jgi:hypothetical protein
MAHFAKISNENKVLAVLTLDDKNTENSEGVEVESIGQAYLEKHNNWPANMWIKTSYNTSKNTHKKGGTPFRGNYAGIGYKWDAIDQIFWPPQPYPSWVKNMSEARWESPIGDAPQISDEEKLLSAYIWNEETQSWDFVTKNT